MNDPQTFIRLFVENERRIYGFIVSLLPNLIEAEDLLQETSLILWEKFSEFEIGTDFAAWACSIARFKVLQWFDKQGRAKVRFSQAAIDAITDEVAADDRGGDHRHMALAECVEKLTERDRDLIARRYADESSVKTVAEEVGRSADAVYKALQRIHDTLLNCVRLTMLREARQ